MFSLIITIISVALVAALALATLYYGGAAFNEGRADAEASKIINQGQQVLAAADLYYANHGTWPTVAKMVADGYLKSAPQAQAPAVGNAMAASVPWVQVTADVPVYLLEGVQVDTCRSVNKHAYSLNGILPQALMVYSTQCYGASQATEDLRTVVSKGGGHLAAAGLADTALMPATDLYPEGTALPAADAEGAWTAPPGVAVADGSGAPAGGGASGATARATFSLTQAGPGEVTWAFTEDSAQPVDLTPIASGRLYIQVWTDDYVDYSGPNICGAYVSDHSYSDGNDVLSDLAPCEYSWDYGTNWPDSLLQNHTGNNLVVTLYPMGSWNGPRYGQQTFVPLNSLAAQPVSGQTQYLWCVTFDTEASPWNLTSSVTGPCNPGDGPPPPTPPAACDPMDPGCESVTGSGGG